MRRISLLLLIAFMATCLAAAHAHTMEMSSDDMIPSQCLDHCLQSAGTATTPVSPLMFSTLFVIAALGLALVQRERPSLALALGNDGHDILLLKRSLASVILRN